jgi:hypothetical protein
LSATLGHCSSAYTKLHINLRSTFPYFGGHFGGGFGGVGTVFNARGFVCGCVNRALKFTPQARVMFFGKQASKSTHDADLDKHCTL